MPETQSIDHHSVFRMAYMPRKYENKWQLLLVILLEKNPIPISEYVGWMCWNEHWTVDERDPRWIHCSRLNFFMLYNFVIEKYFGPLQKNISFVCRKYFVHLQKNILVESVPNSDLHTFLWAGCDTDLFWPI